MDQIKKMLRRVTPKEKNRIKVVIGKLRAGDDEELGIVQLKGRENIYRVRIGRHRLILRRERNVYRPIVLLRRNEKTYKKR